MVKFEVGIWDQVLVNVSNYSTSTATHLGTTYTDNNNNKVYWRNNHGQEAARTRIDTLLALI